MVFKVICKRVFCRSDRIVSWSYGCSKICNKPLIINQTNYWYMVDKQSFSTRRGVCGEIVFGIHPVYLALTSRRREHMYTLYIKADHAASSRLVEIKSLAEMLGIPVREESVRWLNTLAAAAGPHQGVCLDATPLTYKPVKDLECFLSGDRYSPPSLWLLLDQIKDPMNVGSILRTSYYLGVSGLICTSHNMSPLSPVVSKASSGVMECWTHLYAADDLPDIVNKFQSHHFLIVGTSSATGRDDGRLVTVNDLLKCCCRESGRSKTLGSVLLIIGNEGVGVSCDLLSMCDQLLTIPGDNKLLQTLSQRRLDSINVSAAAAILIHTIRLCQS